MSVREVNHVGSGSVEVFSSAADGKSQRRHELIFRTAGNYRGVPVLLFHGGPGYYMVDEDLSGAVFDLNVYFIITFDQRGCGKSSPPAHALAFNAFEDLSIETIVDDAEKIRKHVLKLHGRSCGERCVVAGWSWGSAAAAAFAVRFPAMVRGILVQGIYLGTVDEHRWLFRVAAKMAKSDPVVAEAWTILREFLMRCLRMNTASSGPPPPLEDVDPLVLHEAVRDFVFSAVPKQCELRTGPQIIGWQCTDDIERRTTSLSQHECRDSAQGSYLAFMVQPSNRCDHAGQDDGACCCVEMAHRVLALWSQFENLLTYPEESPHYLAKMRVAADLTRNHQQYRASHKDVTGALMQLILFPRMMRRQPALAEQLAKCITTKHFADIAIHIVTGESDLVCPPAAATALVDAIQQATGGRVLARNSVYEGGKQVPLLSSNAHHQRGPKRRHEALPMRSLRHHWCRDSHHEACDGGSMEHALRSAAAELAVWILETQGE